MMRKRYFAGSIAIAVAMLGANALAQGSCAPPSFTGPDGPRPSQPPQDNGSGSTSTGSGDVSKPTSDPRTGTTRDPRTGPRGPRGMALTFTRGKSSRKRLKIDWDYPKATGERALDYESALHAVRGDDPRPLLILREGSQYGKDYDLMLERKLANEKTILLSKWFHCVRFTTNVTEESHPFNALFSGKYPPHVFVVSWDGHNNVPLSGVYTLGQIWRGMTKVLRPEYKRDPNRAIRDWFKLLHELDAVDSRETLLRKQMDKIEFKHGPKSPKLRSLNRRLAKLQKQRAGIRKREASVLDLGLMRSTRSKKSGLLQKLRRTR